MPDGPLHYLRVRYDGFVELGDEVDQEDLDAGTFRVRAGDLVLSHINAVNGAVGMVTEATAGAIVTTEFTVCRAREGVDIRIVWMALRSPEARADLLLLATGIGRSRVRWEEAKELMLPMPPADVARQVTEALNEAEEKEQGARNARARAHDELMGRLRLVSAEAIDVIAAFKPPR